jgi:hypothetical protein
MAVEGLKLSWKLGAGSWKLEAGSWELGAGSWENNNASGNYCKHSAT